MREIFYELIKEARDGRVIIDEDERPIAFNTRIIENNTDKVSYFNDNNLSTLVIKREEEFFKLLEEYINLELESNREKRKFYKDSERNKIKWIMTYLFVNATTEDFINPENLLRRNIDFLRDSTFKKLDNGVETSPIESLYDSRIFIKNSSCSNSMETPNKIEISLRKTIGNEEVIFDLPSIYYGISNGTCYIYSLLNPRKRKSSEAEKKYQRKMNRLLYKLNDGVVDSQEYYDYKEGKDDYYPEDNISDVTHSFILSLSIFISLLEKNDIKKIKAVPYLPLRYLSRELAASIVENEERRKELQQRSLNIQTNVTNKFIRTFNRLAYHNSNIDITMYPFQFDEFLTMKLGDKKEINNMILEEADNNIERNTTSSNVK